MVFVEKLFRGSGWFITQYISYVINHWSPDCFIVTASTFLWSLFLQVNIDLINLIMDLCFYK